ncbi:MAG: hypothetical protein JJ992_12065, partial [Planctomycetes bacterium]|nr:hypothetical protein [Planctomycetota bacterium]
MFDHRPAAQAFVWLSATGIAALVLYFATTDWGRDLLSIEEPKVGKPDTFGDVVTVVWIVLLAASVLPTLLGELAGRSMVRAEKVESRRVIAAVAAGLALSAAATYGSL